MHNPEREPSWYVATTLPGATREARLRIVTRGQLAGEPLQPERKGENEAERNLRDAGFDCYFPRRRQDIRNRRNHKITTRAFPLISGYIFVAARDCGQLAHAVRSMRFVGQLLGVGGTPMPVPAMMVERFRQAEDALEFDDTAEARRRRARSRRDRHSTLRELWPAGLPVTPKDAGHPFFGFHGRVESVTGRGMIRVMLNILGGLTPCEIDPSELEAA